MRFGSRGALFGLLSLAGVLAPAAGLAYLGASSYRADRGLVANKLREHSRAARTVAGAVEQEVRSALSAAAALFGGAPGAAPLPLAVQELRGRHPLAERPFRVEPDGRVRYAVPNPLAPEPAEPLEGDGFLPRARYCPSRESDGCARSLDQARRRERALCKDVPRAECRPNPRALAEVRRAYAGLRGWDDTGPVALLALARVHRLAGEGALAIAAYRELAQRFGARPDQVDVAYGLLAAVGEVLTRGEGRPILELYRQLVSGQFRAPPAALLAIAELLRRELVAHRLDDAEQRAVAALDGRVALARAHARAVAELEIEADNMVRTAVKDARSRPASQRADETLAYVRAGDGVVGIVIDEAMLTHIAQNMALPLNEPEPTTRAVVERVGAESSPRQRTLATAGFGTMLPHLTLRLVNDSARPDPLDEIVRERGRRHMVLTAGLIALLLAGVWATVRSAARERELARLKSDFVSTVSHELKTPLTSIRMFAEMLREGVAGGDREREGRYHSIIVRESERLGLLISNLLDYSQIERGTRRYVSEPQLAADVARDAVDTFLRLREGEQTRVELSVADGADTARVNVDRAVVVQSLLNLLANAAKYAGREHPIDTAVERRDGGWIAISVRDRGPGIPRKEQTAIFKEFYRAPQAYSSGVEGTGLGLALVKRHVEALGGRVELQSALGRGSTFTILLLEGES
jgi:signal transduction histidine kinase